MTFKPFHILVLNSLYKKITLWCVGRCSFCSQQFGYWSTLRLPRCLLASCHWTKSCIIARLIFFPYCISAFLSALWLIDIALWPASFSPITRSECQICLSASWINTDPFSVSLLCLEAQEAGSCILRLSLQLQDKLSFNSNCLCPVFRPPKCWRWLFFGWSLTAWRCFCWSSPHERWSSSTERQDSRWCWTGT